MIKHDAVPKYFKHRYLLSDFGWVVMDPLDGRERNMIQGPVSFFFRGTRCDASRHSDLILET